MPAVGVAPERECEREQMVSPRTAGMEIRRLEHRADPRRRPFEILVAAAENERAARGRLDEMEQHPQRRRLPGAVRPEEPGHRPTLERKGQVVHCEQRRRSAC